MTQHGENVCVAFAWVAGIAIFFGSFAIGDWIEGRNYQACVTHHEPKVCK